MRYEEDKERYLYQYKGQILYIKKSDILHIPHISMDGIQGKGIIEYARESLGIAKAQDEFVSKYFGSGIHPSVFVQLEKVLSEDARKSLQKDFNENYGGLKKAWKAIFLSGGAKVIPAEVDAQKAQALESRIFSVVEIARWMNIPPHILRDLVNATFSNIEEQGLELVIYTLLPLATQIEQEMNISLFDNEERRKHYIKFELKAIHRGDIKTRTEFYKAMLDRGVFNADQVLELEDMNPQPDGLGKIYMTPLNMVNKKMLLSEQSLKIESKARDRIEKNPEQIVENRSAALRRRLTIAYKPKFRKYAKKLIRKEVDAVRAAAKKMLTEKGVADFSLWLNDFYREFPKEIDKLATPVISSYATDLLPIAQEEAASEIDIGPEYEDFQSRYREKLTQRHTISSREQLKSVLRKAQEAKAGELEAIEQRLDEWEEKRPDKIIIRETIQAENAFTHSAFALSGIQKIRSMAYDTSCPYCSNLDGKVIGIQQYFLTKGDFQVEGVEKPLTVSNDCRHPPYHGSCDCGISIG